MLFVGQNMPNHYMGIHRGKTGYNPIFLLHIGNPHSEFLKSLQGIPNKKSLREIKISQKEFPIRTLV